MGFFFILVGFSGRPRGAEGGGRVLHSEHMSRWCPAEGARRFWCPAPAAVCRRSAPVACAERWPLAGPVQGAQNGGRGGTGERGG